MTNASIEVPSPTKSVSLAAHLRTAVVNQRIYPSGSPMVERTVGLIFQSAEAALKTADRLTVTDRQGRIYIQGKESVDAAGLSAVFIENGVQNITFYPGVTPREVAALVRILSRKESNRPIAERLAGFQVSRIRSEQVTVVELEDGETVSRKVDALFNEVGDFPHLVTSLRSAFEIMEGLPTQAKQKDARERVASRLAEMPSHLLRDLLENTLPPRLEASGLREDVLKRMTSEKVHDILGEVGQWYNNIRQSCDSEFEAMEHLTKLKGFLGKLLSSPAGRRVPFAIYEELLQQGLIEEIPADVEKGAEESLAARVDRLTAAVPAALLENPERSTLPELFRKLDAVGLHDALRTLLAKLLENFRQDSSILRLMAVKTVRAVLPVLRDAQTPSAADGLFLNVVRLADQERSHETYKEVVDVLADGVHYLLTEDRASEAREVLALLRRHAEDLSHVMTERSGAAQAALTRSARENAEILSGEMLSEEEGRRDAAAALMHVFGPFAAPLLTSAVKRSPDVRRRRSAAHALKRMGEAGEKSLAAELHPGVSTPEVLNLLEAAEEFPSAVMTSALASFVHDPDPFVRGRIVHILSRRGQEEECRLLIHFLSDKEEAVQVDAIRALGDLGEKKAAFKLAEMLPEGSMLRREEICLALGKISDDAGVPALLKALDVRGGLFKTRNEQEETVRVRAAWALGAILSPQARRALLPYVNDPNQQVRFIARQRVGLA